MADVFVNYRTADAAHGAAAAYELLSARFGADRVFRDCVSMSPGEVYPAAIREHLESARVLLVLIGDGWFARTGGRFRRRRLVDDRRDWVRREIRRALERGIPVVPVLLDGAPPPSADELPGDVAPLAHRQAAQVSHRTLGEDIARLADRVAGLVPELVLPDLFETVPDLPDDPLPSMLLRPEYGIVPFEGRDQEMADLTRWLDSPEPVGVRLLTGPGGQGKTRLADELIRAADGWTAGFVAEATPVLHLIREFRTPLLLVVDYAEGRTAQLAALAAALAARPADKGPVRVLMLARSPGLWQRLLRGVRDDRVALMFTEVPAVPLAPLLPTARDHDAEFDRALEAFAARLPGGLPAPERPPGLAATRYERALDVHAAALATLLDQTTAGPTPPRENPVAQDRLDQAAGDPVAAREDPVARVLEHERRHWSGSAAPYALADPHPDRLDQVVSAATLFGAADATAAHALLAALPTFDGCGRDVVDRYRRWLADLYPGPAALNPLRPDRLGEDLVAATLRERPEFGTALASVIGDAQLTHALTVLGRAAPRHTGVRETMSALLTTDLMGRVPFAIAVATRAEDLTLTGVLSELLETGDDLALDEAVVENLPDQTLALAAFAVVQTRAALDRHLAQDEPDEGVVAWLTHDLSLRLGAVGQNDEALTTASRAVALFRELAAEDQDYAFDLANALNTLAVAYGMLGMYEDGIEPAEAAVSLLRSLTGSPEIRNVLATSLTSLGTHLSDVARHAEAIAAVEEAVGLQRDEVRDAAEDDRVDRLYRLAEGLDNLATTLDDAGRPGEALALVTEAAEVYRDLDGEDGDRFRGDLIRVLGNLSATYARLDRHEESAVVSEEAVRRARDLVARYGETHVPRLANILNTSASVLRRLGRHDDALAQINEAVALFRECARTRPGTELSGLAAALSNLGNCLDDTGDPGGARDAYDESIDIYRKLSDPYPGTFEPDLAELLMSMANFADGDPGSALDLAAEAAAILKQLVDSGRNELRHKLGTALHLLAAIRYDLGQYGEAARVEAQAAEIFAALARHGEAGRRADQAWALHGLARAYDVEGRHEDAERPFGRAAGLLRELAREDDAHEDELACVLLNSAVCLSSLGRDDEANDLITEATAIRRRRLDDGPRRRRELAEALNNLADTRNDLGDRESALPAAREAVALLREDHDGADETYVYALCTLATVTGDEDLDDAVSPLVTARRVAQDDDDLRAVVRTTLEGLGAKARQAWRRLTDDPYP
ncbi:tetratricopeptide repeat protein [Actinomadura sp. DC4]|uniref:tetratricopeptide repeat protein n=1 Tax=Actinomadura sp. DC4 TaxID=3055069 RepID=UPI0025AEEC7D|nr:tetratricopeptide repeat protein [Actinomadura sp. DC4]MDN3358227.1 tetratricopeptide repeat protein [Actinomadura sp. DC4]